jgi:hypothetical protein
MRDLEIKITVDGTQAKRELGDIDKALGLVDKTAEKAGSPAGGLGKMETSLAKIGAAVGGVAALNKAVDNVFKLSTQSVTAFAEQEAALKQLETALTAQGVAVPATMQLYADLATQFQNTTVSSDDLIAEMQALLVQVGGVMPDQMAAALEAATNLSAGLNIDLRTATMAVAKAFDGGGQALTRMLPSLRDLVKEGATTTEILDALNQRFDGAAVAQMDTYAGKVAHLKNNWNEFQERIGSALVSVLDPLLEWFLNLPGPVQTFTMGVAGLTAVLAPLAAAVELLARLFGQSLIPLLSRALPAAFTALRVFIGPVGWVLLAITAIYEAWKHWDTIGPMVQRIYTAVKTWLVDKFKAVVDTIKGYIGSVTNAFKDMYDKVVGNSYVPDMVMGIAREFGKLDAVMVNPVKEGASKVFGIFGDLMGDIGRVVGRMFGGGSGGGILHGLISDGLASLGNLLFPGFGAILAGLAPILSAGLAKLGGLFKDFFSWIWDGFKAIGSAIGNALGLGSGPTDTGPPQTGVTDPNTGIDYPDFIPGANPATTPDTMQFGLGGYVPGVGPQRAIVHGGEGVLNPSAMSRLGKSGLDAMNRGNWSGGAITVNVNVTGGVIDDVKTQRQLAAIVTQAMDQDYRLRRKVSAR